MAQLQAISSCSSPKTSIHGYGRHGMPVYRDNMCCLKKPAGSYQEMGASYGGFRGNLVAHHARSQIRSVQNRGIQSVLSGEKDVSGPSKTDVYGSHSGSVVRGKLNKVVLAYSGGLDTSVIVPWLRENYGCDVVCFTADVGQGTMEMDGLERKAKASGASQLVVKDLKEEFVRDYIFPCLRVGAVYERKYLLGTSMARPVIAKVINIRVHPVASWWGSGALNLPS